jgi:hypothetical protein
MKKILIFLIVLGAITFINIDLFASTYDDPVSNQVLDLYTPVNDLDGATLLEFFETGPSIIFDERFNGVLNETPLSGGNYTFLNNEYLVFDTSLSVYLYFEFINNGNVYVNINGYSDGNGIVNLRLGTVNLDNFEFLGLNNYSSEVFNNIQTDQLRLNRYADTGVVYIDRLLVVDLDYYDINLSKYQLDYYYQLYIALKAGIDLSIYFTQGYDDGYDDGYDSGESYGYLDGYNDGLVEGYYDGQVDYGILSNGTWYSATIWGQSKYNEGMDYAAIEGITLLSIFQMIIGVVFNMITFIATIEVFGISIASVLAGLSLIVVGIWTLKLLRG